jgi:hypothetical protein
MNGFFNRDRESGKPLSSATPPGVRIRTGQFEKSRFAEAGRCCMDRAEIGYSGRDS